MTREGAGDRPPRSRWFDPRFAIGIVLVLASVAGVVVVVSAADGGVQVYAARAALSPGDRVHRGDLELKSVRLGAVRDRYLGPADIPAAGVVVTRPVGGGELVPASAVGSTSSLRVASLVITVKGQLSRSVEAGAVVDVWSAAALDGGAFGEPAVLVYSATVVRVIKPEGITATGSESVELLVARSTTARVLAAVADGDALSLVPTALPIGG